MTDCIQNQGVVATLAAALTLMGLLLKPTDIEAQTLEVLGSRALGMGGAFVAVADDGSAVYWNPAGLASGPFFELRFEHGSAEKDGQGNSPLAFRHSSQFFSMSIPALGLSYYRLRSIVVTPQPVQPAAIAQSMPDRETERSAKAALGSLITHHFGVTLLHSLSSNLTVATNIRVVRGMAGAAREAWTGDELLDRAEAVERRASTAVDLDFGALATFGPARVGLVVRNLRQPEFATFILRPSASSGRPEPVDGSTALTVDPELAERVEGRQAQGAPSSAMGTDEAGSAFEFRRQARLGVAFLPGQGKRPNPMTVAVDVDLTRQRTLLAPRRARGALSLSKGGERRNVGVGIEQWMMGRRLGLRGGARWSTVDEVRFTAAGGASLAVRPSMFIDGQVTVGSGDERGWSFAARVSF